MNYRIKSVEEFDGKVFRTQYFLQKKFLFFWMTIASPFVSHKNATEVMDYLIRKKNKQLVYYFYPGDEIVSLENEKRMEFLQAEIDLLEKKILEKQNDPINPTACGAYKTAVSVLKENLEELRNVK